MSRIITFYSYKGGVGRTLALSNVAVLLAKLGKRVLMMDWDIEAPGLDRYFKDYTKQESARQKGLVHLLVEATKNQKADWRPFVQKIRIEKCAPISIISSGDRASDYVERIRAFSWPYFFERHHGGATLDRWREEWKNEYDFVLVDSRTGITDTGGVCTVFLPDILVLVFTANNQSFEAGIQAVNGIQEARRTLAVSRAPLSILPVPGRFDGRTEVDDVSVWMERFSRELKPFYDDWLPKHFDARRILELTKIPYVAKFSFGEPLPVLTHSMSDPEFPGFYLENIARLIASDFAEAAVILSPRATIGNEIANIRAQLAQFPIDESALDRSLKLAEMEMGPTAEFSELLNEAGIALARQNHLSAAELHFTRALAIGETSGNASPHTIASLKQLGDLMIVAQRWSEAELYYRRALEIVGHTLDPNDPRGAEVSKNLASLLVSTGRVNEAEDIYRKTLDRLRESVPPNDPTLTSTLNDFANVLEAKGDLAEAELIYRETLDRSRDNQRGFAIALNHLARVLQRRGEFQEAADTLRQSASIFEELGDTRGTALALHDLGGVLQRLGKFEEAADVLRQSTLTFERLGHAQGVAMALNSLGGALQRLGRFEESADVLRRSSLTLDRLGDARGFAIAQSSLGGALLRLGKLEEAAESFRKSASTLEKLGDARSLAMVLNSLGGVLQRSGKFEEAAAILRKSISTFERIGDARGLAMVLNSLGGVLLRLDKLEEAADVLQRSDKLFAEQGDQRGQAMTLKSLATVLERLGRSPEAAEVLQRSQDL